MTVADLCLLAAVVVYIATIAIPKAVARQQFDNAKPRDPAFYKDPFRARALGAHLNGIESFPLFAVAVILAEMHGASQTMVDDLAVAFVMVRIAYVAAYYTDRPTLRSILFCVGFALNLAIFFAPVWAAGPKPA
ncbi:MAG: hypothetical protein JWO72_3226 [Caulobacteraceae bacterium]|jgi:uncharacterized MAPEG superfamily protein|nr:hypothetical protein [Caulobacteraceae bacterium]